MRGVLDKIKLVAGTDSTILILGRAARAKNWSPMPFIRTAPAANIR